MKAFFKDKFALTEQGATDLVKSTVASFFGYVVNMLPLILFMMFFEQLVLGSMKSNQFYFIMSAVVLLVMYAVLNIEYNSLYNATFKESENMRVDIARTLSELPLSYFSKHDLSDLAQTIMKDVAGIEHAISHAIGKSIAFVGFLVVISIMLLLGNLKLGLAVVLPVYINLILIWLSKKMQIKNQTKYYNKLRENSEHFQEAIELQQEIKSFGIGKQIKEKLYKEMENSEKIQIKSEIYIALIMNLASYVLYTALVGVIVIGVDMLIKGQINILYFVGYLLATIRLKEGADGMSFNMAELFYIDAMIQRIKEIRQTKVQEGQDTNLDSFDIQLENVSFSYNEDTPVIKDVSFVVRQNEVTALVGKSGCGKTSILRLVSRLYDCDDGQIRISGKDIKDISTKSLFDKVSIVFQDVTLFNESVLENVRIGNLNASDEQVKEAIRLANCDEFVENLPQGYDTFIGENGATLSGGQRQRLSIARAFLKNAPIIILDEISSSLDVENEKKIQESLNKLTKGKTVLIISHRLKSIENVDKIVVLDEGKVENIGRHEQLLKKSKVYKDLIGKSRLAEEFAY